MNSLLNKTKNIYSPVSVLFVTLESNSPILAGSIVDKNTTVVIPRGQKVDEFDFSDTQFNQEWDVE